VPQSWKAITIHQLLSHTSGIPSYTDGPEFAQPKMMRILLKPVENLMLTKDKPLEFQPGEKWKYDNSGYIFLGVIIEKVSGDKYADYLKKHIFGVLDMQDSGYDDSSVILKNRAQGYRSVTDGFRNADYLDMSLPYAAGSLYSTVHDLYRWDRALYTDKVLKQASREKM
jgi:D-alanyl-D-alanine carboxypeptidase